MLIHSTTGSSNSTIILKTNVKSPLTIIHNESFLTIVNIPKVIVNPVFRQQSMPSNSVSPPPRPALQLERFLESEVWVSSWSSPAKRLSSSSSAPSSQRPWLEASRLWSSSAVYVAPVTGHISPSIWTCFLLSFVIVQALLFVDEVESASSFLRGEGPCRSPPVLSAGGDCSRRAV